MITNSVKAEMLRPLCNNFGLCLVALASVSTFWPQLWPCGSVLSLNECLVSTLSIWTHLISLVRALKEIISGKFGAELGTSGLVLYCWHRDGFYK